MTSVERATVALHDELCDDGDTRTCGRWRCGIDPGNQFHELHVRHVDYYRNLALVTLTAAGCA